MSATIDHPLLEANRMVGLLSAEYQARILAELNAGDRTPARLRESIFEFLGWQGAMPVAIDAVVDPEMAQDSLGIEGWFAIGVIDDGSVLQMADGSWFGLGRVDQSAVDRQMVIFALPRDVDGATLTAELAAGGKPVWAMPADALLDMGSEREYRAAMAE
jgi:hypothetical protein